MPEIVANGITLAYDVFGEGEPVLLVPGTGQPANTFHIFQVPALVDAGYQVVTFDNRGVSPSESPPAPYAMADFVDDAAGLIEGLGIGPCRVAGVSLGAIITQELALARPDLVRCAAMLGTVGRVTGIGLLFTQSQIDFDESEVELPPLWDAINQLPWLFSAATLANEEFVSTFVSIVGGGNPWRNPGRIGQHLAEHNYGDRLEALAGVTVPSMVMTFEHDAITLAPYGREVAAAIPGCELVEILGVGHGAIVEKPDEVNEALIRFFKDH